MGVPSLRPFSRLREKEGRRDKSVTRPRRRRGDGKSSAETAPLNKTLGGAPGHFVDFSQLVEAAAQMAARYPGPREGVPQPLRHVRDLIGGGQIVGRFDREQVGLQAIQLLEDEIHHEAHHALLRTRSGCVEGVNEGFAVLAHPLSFGGRARSAARAEAPPPCRTADASRRRRHAAPRGRRAHSRDRRESRRGRVDMLLHRRIERLDPGEPRDMDEPIQRDRMRRPFLPRGIM